LAGFVDHRHNLEIEKASLKAWPALEQIHYDGWLLRFSRGYTKRANSVNPLYPSTLQAEVKINTCERVYHARGLPAIFRLTPFASPPHLDRLLAERGYARLDPTQVLSLDLAARTLPAVRDGVLQEWQLDDWLDVFCRFRCVPVRDHESHRAILAAIAGVRNPAVFLVSGEPVACGLAVLEHGLVGLFDLITALEHRNRGYGRRLVTGLLAWGLSNGAQCAYLQVMLENAPARHLYDQLGFREAYRYWYRVPSDEGKP
jgi:ribosomal protein S18 acetylase RimI-like enzyme